jgi:hypothetical protein
LNYSRISLLVAITVAVSSSDNEFDCRPQKSVPADGRRFPGAISPNPTYPARNTAGSPTRRPGRLGSTGARPPQSSFLGSAALENLQINQLQILKILNLKFGLLSCLEPNHQ